METVEIKATVTAFCAGKFKGRAALLRLIEAGDATAVRAVALQTHQERVHAALRGELSPEAAQAVAAAEIKAQADKQITRRLLRKPCPRGLIEQITYRQPGEALERCVRAAFFAALQTAGFREAKHAHSTAYEIAEIGEERAVSASGQLRPGAAGLPQAYIKKGFTVASSEHAFFVSRAILRVPREQRAQSGRLYLSPTVRVVQGRGTTLRTERLSERGKWI